jgi:hypothetical protein
VLQQRATDAVHDALRLSRGAAGEHDVERRVEGLAREGDLAGLVGCDEAGQALAAVDGRDIGRVFQVGDDDDLREAGQLFAEFGDARARVDGLAVVVVAVGLGVLLRVVPWDVPGLEDVTIDGRVVLFTLLVSMVTGLVFGLVAAFPAMRADLNGMLREDQRTGAGRRVGRLRDVLIGVEAALAMVLLAERGC